MRAPAAVVTAVAWCMLTSVARAETSADEQRAEALFDEGKTLRGEGRYPAACADFEESRRLVEGIGVTLYLADCYEHAGEVPRALAEFRRAEALAVARGDDKRAAVAHRRAEAIESPAPAESPAPSAPLAPDSPVQSSAGAMPFRDDAVARSHATRRWLGVGIAGAGVVGIGVGAAFGAMALSKLSRSNDGPCGPDDHCTADGLALRHQSATAATGSTVGFVAGATLVAAGLAVYLTTPRDGEPVTLTPVATAAGVGAVLAGRF